MIVCIFKIKKQISIALKAILICFFNVCLLGNVFSQQTYYSINSSDVSNVVNWNTATDGSGSNPVNFNNTADIFIVQNGHSCTLTINTTIAGLLTLNGTGTIQINGYDLTLGGLTATGSSVINNSGASKTLTIGSLNADNTFTGTISGAISLIKTGTNTFTIKGLQSYTGSTTVNNGKLALGGGAAPSVETQLPANTYVYVAAGAYLEINGVGGGNNNETIGSLTGGGKIISGNYTTMAKLTINNSIDCEFSGVIRGNLDSLKLTVVKTNTGTLTLSGNNGFKEALTISAGVVKIGTSGNIIYDKCAVTITSPGILDMNTFNERVGSIAGTGTIDNILGGGTPTLTFGGDNSTTTFSGTIQNTTGLLSITKTGNGTLTLSGGNNLTYDGATSVTAGTLILVDCGALATGNSPASFDISSGAVLEFNANSNTLNLGSTAVSGTVITGTGTLRKTGGWPLALGNQGTSLYKVYLNMTGGLIDIEGGTIMNGGWSGGQWTNNKAGLYIASGAKLDVWDGNTIYVDALLGSGVIDKGQSGALTINIGTNNGSGTFSGIIQNANGTISITKQGNGTQTLSGTNTYTGTTTISEGTLKLGANGVIPNGTALTITSPGIFDMNTYSDTIGSITGTGTIDNVAGGGIPTLTCGGNNSSTTFSGTITNASGNLSFTKEGSGTLTLSGTNSYSGTTKIQNTGTIIANTTSSLGTSTVNLYGGNLSVLINGAGNNGTINLGNNFLINSTMSGTIYVANNGSNTGNTISFGSFNIGASSTLNITGANGYNVQFSSMDLLGGSAGTSTINPTSANISIGSMTTNSNLHTVQLGGTSTENIITGVISDNSTVIAITKTNTSIWTLSGVNTYTGTTTINQGTLKLGAAGVIPDASAVTVSSPGILDMNTYSETVGSIAGTGTIDNVAGGGTPTLTCGGDNSNTTFSGIIQNTTGTLALTKSGNGTLILSGSNTFSGLTTISSGILQLSNTAALGTNSVGTVVNNGSSLDLNGLTYATEETLTLNGTGYSNGGALKNSNITTASFAGTITLSGTTTINTENQITLSGNISNNQNLTKTGSNSLIFSSNTININSLVISAGTINAGSSTMNLQGDFTNNGTFTANSCNFNLIGTGQQSIPAVTFNNLTINNSTGAVLGGNIIVNGTLTLTDGILNTTSYYVDLGANGTLVETSINPTSYILGTVKVTRLLMQNSNNIFGGIGVEITEKNENNNSTEVIRVTGTACIGIGGNQSITRYFSINPTIDENLDAELVFHYFDNEITGHTEANLDIYKSIDSRVTWSKFTPSTRNEANNTLTLGGITSFSDWTASDGVNESLPIELIDFSTIVSELGIEINWVTASEQNNDFFTVERSYDGIAWENITQIVGNGNSTFVNEYEFLDNTFRGNILYYRLKQTDYDGTISYSKIITVSFLNNNDSLIKAYYIKQEQKIIFESNFYSELRYFEFVELLSINGNLAYKSYEFKPINTSELSKGIYYVYVKLKNNEFAQRIIID